jgi:hypothetical protein
MFPETEQDATHVIQKWGASLKAGLDEMMTGGSCSHKRFKVVQW